MSRSYLLCGVVRLNCIAKLVFPRLWNTVKIPARPQTPYASQRSQDHSQCCGIYSSVAVLRGRFCQTIKRHGSLFSVESGTNVIPYLEQLASDRVSRSESKLVVIQQTIFLQVVDDPGQQQGFEDPPCQASKQLPHAWPLLQEYSTLRSDDDAALDKGYSDSHIACTSHLVCGFHVGTQYVDHEYRAGRVTSCIKCTTRFTVVLTDRGTYDLFLFQRRRQVFNENLDRTGALQGTAIPDDADRAAVCANPSVACFQPRPRRPSLTLAQTLERKVHSPRARCGSGALGPVTNALE
ncbi:hypothetical protein Trydic_g9197 [Trypoxylus dichotomus]